MVTVCASLPPPPPPGLQGDGSLQPPEEVLSGGALAALQLQGHGSARPRLARHLHHRTEHECEGRGCGRGSVGVWGEGHVGEARGGMKGTWQDSSGVRGGGVAGLWRCSMSFHSLYIPQYIICQLFLQAKLVSIPVYPGLVAGAFFLGGLLLFLFLQYDTYSWAAWL